MDTTSLTKTVNNNFIAQQITQIIKYIPGDIISCFYTKKACTIINDRLKDND